MPGWDIAVGETLLRRQLHRRWGGGWYGGMEPAPRAQSIFLFTKPVAGEAFGYKYDGWHSDGTFHYTGDGQVGDQSVDEGGNRALLAASAAGRTIRLFRSDGAQTTYLGAFELGDPPFYRADATDRNGELRSVLVFRLVPIGAVIQSAADEVVVDLGAPEQLPLEANNVDAYAMARPDEPPMAARREAELVKRYADWLAAQGESATRHRVPIPGGGYIVTDMFTLHAEELVEAKASSARSYIRSGLGQILDYSRYIPHRTKALLLPTRPNADLIDLLAAHGVHVIWRVGDAFERV